MAIYCVTCGVNCTASKHDCVEKKTCRMCGEEKPIAAFPVHPSSFDGHKHDCTPCYEAKKQQERQQQKAYKLEQKVLVQRKKEQRVLDNLLLKAYGYRWKKEWVGDYEFEPEESFVLHTPTKKPTTPKNAFIDIALLQAHIPGHPSTIWAQEMLACPNTVVLDTETTGLGEDDEILDIAIVDSTGRIRLNTLVQCQRSTIPPQSKAIHHINEQMLRNAHTFPEIWERLMNFLQTREIIIYNADFDLRMLQQTAKRYNLPMPELHVHCLMERYSAYVGQPSLTGNGYRKMSLAAACFHFQIDQTNAHRALADTQTSLLLLRELAGLAQSGDGQIRVGPSLDAPVIQRLLREYSISREDIAHFLDTYSFIVSEGDEQTLQYIRSSLGEHISLTQVLVLIEQQKCNQAFQREDDIINYL